MLRNLPGTNLSASARIATQVWDWRSNSCKDNTSSCSAGGPVLGWSDAVGAFEGS